MDQTLLRNIFKRYEFKYALSVSLSMTLAFILNRFFFSSANYWMVMASFFVCFTVERISSRQSLIHFLLLLTAFISGAVLRVMHFDLMNEGLIAISFILIGGYFFLNELTPTFENVLTILLCIMIIVLLGEETPGAFQKTLLTIFIGGAIGVVVPQLVFSGKLTHPFKQAVRNLFLELEAYTKTLIAYLSNKDVEKFTQALEKLQAAFHSSRGFFPTWVYATGFNPGLRAGFRFYLIELDRLQDNFLVLHALLTEIDLQKWSAFSQALETVMGKNIILLSMLERYFRSEELVPAETNFTEDIKLLEDELRGIVPKQLELLDISQEYLYLTELYKNVKEIRDGLLKLMMSLITT